MAPSFHDIDPSIIIRSLLQQEVPLRILMPAPGNGADLVTRLTFISSYSCNIPESFPCEHPTAYVGWSTCHTGKAQRVLSP